MNEVPSLEEIHVAFEERCDNRCKNCALSGSNCRVQYTYDILTGKRGLTDSIKNPEPKRPAWCKVGAWVTDACPDENEVNGIHMIAGLSEDGSVAHVKDGDGREYFANVVGLKPIHFRPYTFEEAKGLLGKVMKYQSRDGDTTICLIRDVLFNPSQPEREVMINHWEQEAFINAGATINGVPFGKPEIDKNALKGGQE